jgi:hypothetical protein
MKIIEANMKLKQVDILNDPIYIYLLEENKDKNNLLCNMEKCK